MSIKLRELIRNIRACKTAAEERSVIAKECALIRTAFKEEDNTYRHRNVAKLLFMNMLGYPTHFGQIECLKLIASNKFSNKRIGYLGLTILLDENTDILMLVTNSIKNDLKNSNQYINGIALCALGNIANGEMCSALCHEILEMLSGNNPYVKKKATMCAIRILRKTNDLEELFLEKIPFLLEEKNHGVLSAGISLMIALSEKKKEYKNVLKTHINKIMKILKSCVMSGYSHGAEYDVYGITDPFLQVKILRLLKILNDDSVLESSKSERERFKEISRIPPSVEQNNYESISNFEKNELNSNFQYNGNIEHSLGESNSVEPPATENGTCAYDMEEINSILAQVVTNTDAQKNVGNAILYECVKTITYISKEPGLLVLAVNILGKFLQNTDNNIRYVGLCTLQKLLKKDPKTLHIYRNTIIECLKDQDISIRKKALDVSFALITKDSLKMMVKELLNYLLVADVEIKSDIVSNLCIAVNKYAPNMQYLLDTYIKLFCLAGNFIQDHIKDDFIYYLMQSPEYQSYSVFKLFFSMKENLDQHALIQVGTWCLGEYGDLLVKEQNVGPDKEVITVDYDDIFDLLETVAKKYESEYFKELQSLNIKDPVLNFIYNKSINNLKDTNASYISCNINENLSTDDNNVVLQYVIMCLNKLTVRIPSQKKKIAKLIAKYKKNKSIEIQQRACEFHEFMNSQWDDIREQVLLRIPKSKKVIRIEEEPVIPPIDVLSAATNTVDIMQKNNQSPASIPKVNNTYVDLLDLDDILEDQQIHSTKNDFPEKATPPRTSPVNDLPLYLSLNVSDQFGVSDPAKKEGQLIIDEEEKRNGERIREEYEHSDDMLLKKTAEAEVMNKKNEDILADLFGNISIDQPKTVSPVKKIDNSLNLLIDDIPNTMESSIPTVKEKKEHIIALEFDLLDDPMENRVDKVLNIQPMSAYNKNDIEVTFYFEKENADSENTLITATYSNKSSIPVTSFIFEAAVPNYIKLEMCPASSSELHPFEQNKITQNIKIKNTMFKKKPLLMKVRLSYMKNNQMVQDYINLGKFPELL